jgi:hypothetical protein
VEGDVGQMKKRRLHTIVEIQIREFAGPEAPAPVQKIGQFNQGAIKGQLRSVGRIGMREKGEYVAWILNMRIAHDVYDVVVCKTIENGVGEQEQVEKDQKISLEAQRSPKRISVNSWICAFAFYRLFSRWPFQTSILS